MKTLIRIALVGLVVSAFASCIAPLSNRMDSYVTEVQENCDNWTDEDWELSKEEYAKLLEEYSTNYDSYTQAEKQAINKAIGRYNGLLVKRGIEDAGKTLKEFGQRFPSLIQGFISAFDENTEN